VNVGDIGRSVEQPDRAALDFGQPSAVLRDTMSGKIVLKIPYRMVSANTTADGKYLVTPHGTALDLWSLVTGKKARTLRLVPGREEISGYTQVAFSPDDKTLAVLTSDTGQTSLLELWDIPSGTRRAISTGQPPVGGQTRFLDQTSEVRTSPTTAEPEFPPPDQGVVDAATGKRLTAPNFAMDKPLAVNNNGLIGAKRPRSEDHALGRKITPASCRPRLTGDTAAFSPGGRLLAVADGADQIQLWDLTRKQPLGGPLNSLYHTEQDISTIRSLNFTPDGSTLLSVDDFGRIRTHPITPHKIKNALCTRCCRRRRAS